MPAPIRLGTQGWNYDAWVGPFYPEATKAVDFLSVYSRAFETVEVDSTFYATPASKTIRGWAQRTPPGFVFALKLPQEITHERRLRGVDDVAKEFFDRARELEDKLGPVLIQFGAEFHANELPALARFLPTLPEDIAFAVEFRDKSWMHEGVIALLSEHHVALTVTDGRWIPRKQMLALAERPTADFSYVRWMGADREIVDYSRVQIDRSRELELWTGVISQLAGRGRSVYGYVNNHFAGHSPSSVREMQRMLNLSPVDPEQLGEQMTLF
jgi:uncharacterized protein YecE (DUF72 family)